SAWLGAILIGVSVIYLIGEVDVALAPGAGPPLGDFFALWSYARIVLAHPAADLYDFARLHAAQVALGMPDADYNPFPYPPTFLLLILPLGLLSFHAAYAVWMAATVPLYLLAICAAVRNKRAAVCVALLAPATTACLVAGQSGFLLAALQVGGLRLVPWRPVLAGVLFGLLTYKPQFGLLVPVALVAGGQWRSVAAACATAAGLLLVTSAAFGATIWWSWLHALPAYALLFDRDMVGHPLMPTVLENLQALGVAPGVAWVAQMAATITAGIIAWAAWRRLPHALAVPAVIAATCLATPHAFVYDLPMLSGAAILFAAERLQARGALVLPELGTLILVLAIPLAMTMHGVHAPVGAAVIALFAALVMADGQRTARWPGGLSG
nr:glycosyltransferase family 87 protein [Rhodospirillales bacterium]